MGIVIEEAVRTSEGPWEAEDFSAGDNVDVYIYGGERQSRIVARISGNISADGMDPAQTWADATLMAAAPELLAALKR